MSERSKVLDSKSSVPQGTVGSNPTLSAIMFIEKNMNFFKTLVEIFDECLSSFVRDKAATKYARVVL